MNHKPTALAWLRTGTTVLSALLVLIGTETGAKAGEPQLQSARVVVPPTLSFSVPNINVATTATPLPARVSFDQAFFLPFRVLRISVKADGNLTSAGGTTVPVSNVSWTASGAVNGVGANGVLSTTAYTLVYQAQGGASSGRVDVTWRLTMPAGIVRAETLQTTLRWRFEAVFP